MAPCLGFCSTGCTRGDGLRLNATLLLAAVLAASAVGCARLPQSRSTHTPSRAVGPKYVGFFNGADRVDEDSIGRIGVVTSDVYPAGPSWGHGKRILLEPRDGKFDSQMLNGPRAIRVDDELYLYYAGYDGAIWQIGRAVLGVDTLALKSRDDHPVLSFGQPGQWDSVQVFRPSVVEDPRPQTTQRRFAMTYGGYDGTTYRLGIAYSSDGVTWTKSSHNPILEPGSPGDFDERWISGSTPPVFFRGRWHIFYAGYDEDFVGSVGYASSASLDGPWEKQGAVLKPRTDARQSGIDCAAGSDQIAVPNGFAYLPGEPCVLTSDDAHEIVRVESVDASSVVLARPTMSSHSGAVLLSWAAAGLDANIAEYADGEWRIWGTAYGMKGTRDDIFFEATLFAKGPSPENLAYVPAQSPVIDFDPSRPGGFDRTSAENMSWIELR